MSKYIKLEDAIEQVKTEFYGGGYQEWLEISIDNLINRIANLPTIEVSEDCISRDEVIKALRLEYPCMPLFKESRDEWQLKTDGYRKAEEIISTAPSVAPTGRKNRQVERAEGEQIEIDFVKMKG